MPWRLIGFIVLLGIFLVFIAFNLDNRCDINFGFRVFQGVPVFFTVFSSFVVGMLCALPFAVSLRKKKKDRLEKAKKDTDLPPPKPGKKRGKSPDLPELSPLPPEDEGPYGIN
ncbi:MAG: hypothetical protein LBL28_01625 [Treponema sp.]|jgi:uncharacterized integral membrane protein|nr:hypothetical protein [Treponema sp.]